MNKASLFAEAAQWWAAFFGSHQVVSLAVRWLHLAALLVGGGAALAADRQVLAASRAQRAATVGALASTHRTVLGGLVVLFLSGAFLTASDPDTFLGSRLYWGKLGFVVLLLVNGAVLLRAERAASREPEGRGWAWLKATSAVSLVLWLALLYGGLWLTVAA